MLDEIWQLRPIFATGLNGTCLDDALLVLLHAWPKERRRLSKKPRCGKPSSWRRTTYLVAASASCGEYRVTTYTQGEAVRRGGNMGGTRSSNKES